MPIHHLLNKTCQLLMQIVKNHEYYFHKSKNKNYIFEDSKFSYLLYFPEKNLAEYVLYFQSCANKKYLLHLSGQFEERTVHTVNMQQY